MIIIITVSIDEEITTLILSEYQYIWVRGTLP